jgi:hypothetical protein
MKLRGHRTSSVKARDPELLVRLRAAITQENFAESSMAAGKARVSVATVTRIERGHVVSSDKAHAYCDALPGTQCFEKLFETAIERSSSADDGPTSIESEIRYDWEKDIIPAARKVYEELKRFQPNLVVTFQGASSVFSGLVLNLCYSRDEFLRTPVYTVLFLASKELLPAELYHLPGYDQIDTHRFTLQFPKALKEYLKADRQHRKRIALIDDTTTTGASFRELRKHFLSLGYKKVFTACCIFNATIREETPDQASLIPDAIGIIAPHSKYQLPWGPRL